MILSGSTGKRTNELFNTKVYLAGIGVVLSAFFIFGVDQVLGNSSLKNEIISPSTTQTTKSSKPNLNQTDSTEVAPSPTPASGATAQNESNSANTQAMVTIDGQSITASTNEADPGQSVNKTIDTATGSVSISIQEQSSSSSGGMTRSSNRVNVNSSSSGRNNTSVQVNQFNSGGISP